MPFGWIHIAIALLTAQSQPTFRAQVELLRLDVSVVDKSGQPISDLQTGDFIVKVDGKPRTVSFSRFYSSDGAPAAAAPTDAPPSFADNHTATQGRVVVVVVDLESMTPGYEKLVLDTAGSLVDRLGPADSVGLILIPGKGIELTRDHARVRDALQRARGFATASDRRHVLSMREADSIMRDDKRVLDEVVQRECAPSDRACSTDIDREARQLLTDADQHVRTLLTTLAELNGHLAGIDSPRTLVVLSAGLPYRADTDSYFRDLRRRASESGTTTYIVQLDQPETDASSVGKPGTGSLPRGDLTEGLSNLAGATGGSLHSGIGRAVGVFDRIRAEIVHSYQLGVDSVPADADGKTHRIEVQVRREGAVVRARSEFITAKAAPVHRTAADALLLPPGLAEVPLVATAYNTRGEDAATVKLVVVLETPSGTQGGPPSYAFTINGADDKPAFQTTGAMKAHGDGAHVSVATQVAPGRYRLRGAVVDAQGRAGSVELPIAVGMRQAGEFQFSDLIVGTPAAGFTASSRLAPPEAIAILELFTADPAQFEGISVDLELASGETIVASGPTTIAKTQLERRRIAQGELDVPDALAPGTYVLTAVVKRHGRPLTRISRALVR
jgi:VWFA-related protein